MNMTAPQMERKIAELERMVKGLLQPKSKARVIAGGSSPAVTPNYTTSWRCDPETGLFDNSDKLLKYNLQGGASLSDLGVYPVAVPGHTGGIGTKWVVDKAGFYELGITVGVWWPSTLKIDYALDVNAKRNSVYLTSIGGYLADPSEKRATGLIGAINMTRMTCHEFTWRAWSVAGDEWQPEVRIDARDTDNAATTRTPTSTYAEVFVRNLGSYEFCSDTVITFLAQSVPTGEVGFAFNWTAATTGDIDYWSASGLPPGLSIDSETGAVTGTPTTDGTYAAKVFAINCKGMKTEAVSITINP